MGNTEILKQICEAVGGEGASLILCDLDNETPMHPTFIRGFLLDPETLKAFFGEEEVIRIGINKLDYVFRSADYNRKSEGFEKAKEVAIKDWEYFKKTEKVKPVWRFHAAQLITLSVEEILDYYSKHKKI